MPARAPRPSVSATRRGRATRWRVRACPGMILPLSLGVDPAPRRRG